jgi:hypothetical protein
MGKLFHTWKVLEKNPNVSFFKINEGYFVYINMNLSLASQKNNYYYYLKKTLQIKTRSRKVEMKSQPSPAQPGWS